jgi:enoyl-CoA hydratase/carnithine racemase
VVMELALTGETQPVDRFLQLGLISRVVAPGTAVDAAVALAQTIAANAPLAVAATKQIMQKAYDWTEEEAWPAHRKLANKALSSKDSREGARAFAEKRPPVWRGE